MKSITVYRLNVEKTHPDAKLPVRAHPTDSGLDVFADNVKVMYKNKKPWLPVGESFPIELNTNERVLIGTGIKATVGECYEIQVRPRSGNALKKGLTVLNTPGTIDEQYRGEIGVILINTSNETQTIEKNDKIAQLVVAPVFLCEVREVKTLDDTERSDKGFGSSGE